MDHKTAKNLLTEFDAELLGPQDGMRMSRQGSPRVVRKCHVNVPLMYFSYYNLSPLRVGEPVREPPPVS